MARWLATFGLLLHMAVPMAHRPHGAVAASAPMGAYVMDGTGHSAHGHHGDDAAAVPDAPAPKPGHDRPMQCPICQALQFGGPALLPATFVFKTPDIVRVVFQASASDVAVERFASPLQAKMEFTAPLWPRMTVKA